MKPQVILSNKDPIPTIDDERVLVQGESKPAEKERSLRVKLLRHRTLPFGLKMPSHLFLFLWHSLWLRMLVMRISDDDSDDEEEQRRNAFEGWTEYDLT